MDNKFSCFVISPIGEKDSEIRKNSDGLLEFVIKPALAKYNFIIIRADKMVTVTPITNDIIAQIQNADLCIVDLTGHNPNVMYEFGRRHETGKPYILLANNKEKLPFDVSGIRTIFYNIESVPEVIECQNSIQQYIDQLYAEGFASTSSGESLASISEKLSRIERKIEDIKNTQFIPQGFTSEDDLGLDLGLDIIDTFKYYSTTNNIRAAETLLPQLQQVRPYCDFSEYFVEPLAAQGSLIAVSILKENIDYIETLPERRKLEVLLCISQYYMVTNQCEEGYNYILPYLDKYIPLCSDDKYKALLLGQKPRLLSGFSKDYEKIIQLQKETIELNPNNPSCFYNLSMSYESIDDLENAQKSIDKCLKLQEKEKIDIDHLSQAIDIYIKLNNQSKVKSLMNILKETNYPKYVIKKREIGDYPL